MQAILNDIGTEELAHIEMIGTIIYQLTRDLSLKEIKDSGFDTYFVDHTTGVYPIAASGVPFSAEIFQSTGDAIADIHEDLAAEQKARLTYDNILRLTDDPDVRDPIKFLREREIVHYQRFGEGLRLIQDMLDSKISTLSILALTNNKKKRAVVISPLFCTYIKNLPCPSACRSC
mgnify:CR=1 FL=1